MINVLYVDDEPELLNITKLFLEKKSHFNVATALSAEEAFDEIKNRSFDAIISDYEMPEMDGIEFLKELRAGGCDIPFIIFTGKGREDIVIDAINSGADFYLQKGGNPTAQFAELMHKIKQSVKSRQYEEKHRAIFDSTGTAMTILKEDHTISLVNAEFEKLSGYSKDEIEGKLKWTDFVTEESLIRMSEIAVNQMRNPDSLPEKTELKFIAKGGIYRDVFITNKSIPGTGEIVSSLIDITEQKRSKRELAEERERLEVSLRSIGDGVIVTDADGRIVIMNQVAEALTKWDEESARGKPLTEVFNIINEKTRARCENPVDRVLKTGTVVGLANHTALITRDGSKIIIADSAAPILDKTGDILGVVLVFRDQTREKRAQEIKLRLAALVESSDDMIISRDSDDNIVSWNRGAEKITGFSAQEATGQFDSVMIPPDRQNETEEIHERILSGEKIDHFETLRSKKDGTLVDLSLTVSPIVNEDGDIIGTSTIGRDITEKKESERRIAHLNSVLLAIRNVNKLITKEKDCDVLLKESCNTLIETRGYHNVWIALFDDSEKLIVRAEAGIGDQFRETIEQLRNGQMTECAKSALENKGVFTTVDPKKTCADCPFPSGCRGGGILTIRLEYGEKVYGLISVSVPEEYAGDPDEQALFEEIAGDISFALYSMENDEKRRLAEKELEGQREWLSTTLNSIGDGVIATDTAGIVTYLNPVAENLTGWSSKEARGRPLAEIFDIKNEYTSETVQNPVQRVLQEGLIIGLANHTLLFARDGTVWPIDDSGAPIRNKKGEITGAVLVFREISRRKEAEKNILAARERLEKTIEFLPDATFVVDNNGVVTSWNRAIEEMTGVLKEDILGKGNYAYSMAFYGERRPLLLDFIRNPDAGGKYAYDFIKKNGDALYTETCVSEIYGGKGGYLWAKASLLYDQDGKVAGAIETVRDITERKRSETRLAEEKERLELAAEGASLGVWDYNLITGELVLNAFCTESLGYQRYGPKGTFAAYTKLVHPDDRIHMMKSFQEHTEGKTPYSEVKYRIKTRDGQWKWFLDCGKLVEQESDGKPLRMTGIHMDITEKQQSHDAIKEANKKLSLLSSITRHDINNQVTALEGYGELLQEAILERTGENSMETKYISAIRKAGTTIQRQILFTREYQDIGIHAAEWQNVSEVAARVSSIACSGKVNLNIDTGGLKIFADPMLEKVFSNLSDNTIRHGGDVTEIAVSFYKDNDRGVLLFEDDGDGVADKIKPYIFDRGVGSNTGYGLFLTKDILEITDISITETGKEGRGARFELTLPAGGWQTE
ncbi:MAG: PAS domain S-box protein [Euryarchaeota archaeon]|nr:PAS domain S-box protein [Euryarchaeota archaeon]